MRQLLIAAVGLLSACSSEDFEKLQAQAAPVGESAHRVVTRLHRGAVLLTVTRTLENPTLAYQEVRHTLAVPPGAIATSLRVGGQAEQLLGAGEAAERWSTLLGPGPAEPSVSALLERGFDGLTLSVFGFAPQSTLTVSYELQLPPAAGKGGWEFVYPRDEESDDWAPAPPDFDLTQTPGAAAVADLAATTVRLPRPPINRVDAKWALYELGADRTLWRFELDAAPVLVPAPVRPNVVFVVDASHSMGPEGIASQLELLAPYLANAADAQVEVVLYRRNATRLFGRFIPAGDVARMLATTPAEQLAPGNGSNLELGARAAAEALAAVAGTGRIVLFTDDQLRNGFTNDAALAALALAPRDTVVHVVSRGGSSGELSEARVLDHRLAPIAEESGGIVLEVNGSVGDRAEAAQVLLGLVRPVRIDDFAVEAKGLDGDRLDTPAALDEGAALRFHAIAVSPPSSVLMTGRIWGRPFRQEVFVDPDLTQWLPGIALGVEELESQLTDEEVLAAATQTRAVSRMTSYLSVAPSAGASTIGSDRLGYRSIGMGSFGCSSRCGGGHGCSGYRVGLAAPDYIAVLKSLLADGVAACARTHGGPSVVGSVTVEATGDEVVDVTVAAESAELAACIGEVAWSLRLPGTFWAHRTYEVPLE